MYETFTWNELFIRAKQAHFHLTDNNVAGFLLLLLIKWATTHVSTSYKMSLCHGYRRLINMSSVPLLSRLQLPVHTPPPHPVVLTSYLTAQWQLPPTFNGLNQFTCFTECILGARHNTIAADFMSGIIVICCDEFYANDSMWTTIARVSTVSVSSRWGGGGWEARGCAALPFITPTVYGTHRPHLLSLSPSRQ